MGQPVDLVYLDFSKAFDKGDYMRLFRKLEAYGIEGVVLNWIKSCLSGRRQQININIIQIGWRSLMVYLRDQF